LLSPLAKSIRCQTPPKDGSGPDFTLVIFSDNGERKATVHVKKVVMSEAEWQRLLSPEEFAVTRRKGTEGVYRPLLEQS